MIIECWVILTRWDKRDISYSLCERFGLRKLITLNYSLELFNWIQLWRVWKIYAFTLFVSILPHAAYFNRRIDRSVIFDNIKASHFRISVRDVQCLSYKIKIIASCGTFCSRGFTTLDLNFFKEAEVSTLKVTRVGCNVALLKKDYIRLS